MDYRILGPLEVSNGGRPLGLGGEKQRALLAILLLHRNEVVASDRLIDGLWDGAPPSSALGALQAYVSRLRRSLNLDGATASGGEGDGASGSSNGVLLTRGHGYLLRVAEGELDVDRFAALVERGREALAAGAPGEAADVLREALALWRGPALADFAYAGFAQSAIAQLEEQQLEAVEERVEADLALGRDRELVAELRALVALHPLRERLRGQLMRALYRSGRQAEALEVYQDFRRALSEQLGLEPSPGLQQLELAILTRDVSLDPPVGGGLLGRPLPAFSAAVRARVPRGWLGLALLGLGLAALVVAGVVITSGGGGKRPVSAGDSVVVISPSGGVSGAVVPVGSSPSDLAAGAGAVWVSEYNASAVLRIDPETRAVQTIPAGSTPSGIAVGAGDVWVANNFAGTVSRIDPAVDRVVQTVPVGNGPSGVAVGDGSVWVTNSSDGTLSRINAITGAVRATVALGGGATDVAVGLGGVWVSDSTNGRVVRVDPRGDQVVGSIDVGTGPGAIAVGDGSVWVANSLDGIVTRVDPQTNQVAASIPVGNGPSAIAVGSGGLWVANEFSGSLSRIDSATNTVTRAIALAGRPAALALAGGVLWAGTRAAGRVHQGGTLTVMSNGGFGSPDPASPNALIPSFLTLSMTNDGLTAYRRVGGSDGVQLVPDLAISLPAPTDGGTTYTFQLRRGVRYSNGEPLRPEDFRRAFERLFALEGGVNSPGDLGIEGGAACLAHHGRCDLSQGIVTDDRANTMTVHLVAPDPEFLDKLTCTCAVAVPATTPMTDLGTRPLPATGPYEIASYTPREVRLVRNPYFHEWSHAAQPDGYPDQIVWRIGASVESAVTAVEQGRADYTLDPPPADRLNELETRFASQLNVNPNDVTVGWTMNTRVAPLNDLSVRRALNYAVDRGKIRSHARHGFTADLPATPAVRAGIQAVLPLHRRPQPLGGLARAQSRQGLGADRGLENARRADHGLEPGRTADHHQCGCDRDQPLSGRAARPTRLPRHAQDPRSDRHRLPAAKLATEDPRLARLRLPRLSRRVATPRPAVHQLPNLHTGITQQPQRPRAVRPSPRRHRAQRARGRGRRIAHRHIALGPSRPGVHRPGARRRVRHPEHRRPRLPPSRQLPIQPPARRAHRPTLGAVARPETSQLRGLMLSALASNRMPAAIAKQDSSIKPAPTRFSPLAQPAAPPATIAP
jgi:YVTN family beta-propeller protein